MWSLLPSVTQEISTFVPVPSSSVANCSYWLTAWIVDSSDDVDVDALDPTPAEGRSDDPNIWLPQLWQRYVDAAGTGDISLAAEIEDIRSLAYQDVIDLILAPADPEFTMPENMRVCESSIVRGDDRTIALIYTFDRGEGAEFSAGVFRRTANGTWIWLGNDLHARSETLLPCLAGANG